MTRRPLDLTGRAFGNLVAVSVADNTGKRSWVCVCKCKRSVVVPTSQLTGGYKRKCGECDFEEMIGERYGSLTVQEVFPGPERAVARCMCDCGNTKDVLVSKLKNKRARSCGCLQYVRPKRGRSIMSLINRKFDSYQRNASAKKYAFQLSKEEASALFLSECFYCGAKPDPLNGIDRMINSSGYVSGNVVSCCCDCNYMKSAKSTDQFLDRVYSIYEHTKGRTR